MASTTIARRYRLCAEAFGLLCNALEHAQAKFLEQMPLLEMQTQAGRLRVWAGNLAAHREGRMSLDHRLRQATHVRQGAIDLLDDLYSNLRDGLAIIHNERLPYDEQSSDSDSTDSSSTNDSLTFPPELEQISEDVKQTISYLYELAILVRNPAPLDRIQNADEVNTSHFEEWDMKHVGERFPLLATVSPFLLQRLGKANTRRRQIFKYNELHNKRLKRGIDGMTGRAEPVVTIISRSLESREDDVRTDTIVRDQDEVFERAPSIHAPTLDTQTTVATYVEKPDFSMNFDRNDEVSVTSSAASESPTDEGALKIPEPPSDALDGKHFECPYCYELTRTPDRESWKMHLFEDLQPYVCTFEHCSQPYKTYASRREWFRHEAHMHRMHWTCQQCREVFSNQAGFVEHRRGQHSISSSEEQLKTLIDMCSRPADYNSIGKCSMCFQDDQPLRIHMGHHMVSLALFALPRQYDDKTNDYESNQGQAGASEEDSNAKDLLGALSDSDSMTEVSEAANEEVVDYILTEEGEPRLDTVVARAEIDPSPIDHRPNVIVEADDFWGRAHQTLQNQDLWLAYEKVLIQELGAGSAAEITTSGSPLTCEQATLLISGADSLEDPKWGSMDSVEADRLIRAILFVKESISIKPSPDSHAAFAWAGICVLLPVILHPLHDSEGDEDLFDCAGVLDALDYMCALINRLVIIQHLYGQQNLDPTNSIPQEASPFKPSFEDQMTLLCSQILTTQAQAVYELLGLKKPSDESSLPSLLADLKRVVAKCHDIPKVGDHENLRAAMMQRERHMDDLYRSQRQKWQAQREPTQEAQEEQIFVDSIEAAKACLSALHTATPADRKKLIPHRLPGTCRWVLDHPKYRSWLEGRGANVLWISTDSGQGKSVLSKFLVDEELRSTALATTCYFFFRYDEAQNRSVTNALCALLYQLCSQNRALLQRAAHAFKLNGNKLHKSFAWLWDLLLSLTQYPEAGKVVCLLDGLDECDWEGITNLKESLNIYAEGKESKSRLSILVTSRPSNDVIMGFSSKILWLAGEEEHDAIKRDLELVARERGSRIARQTALDYDIPYILQSLILQAQTPSHLWLNLTLVAIEQASGVNGAKKMAKFFAHLPKNTNEAFEALLKLSPQLEQASKLLHIAVAALRPLTLGEMNIALSVKEGQRSPADDQLRSEQSLSKYIANLCAPILCVNYGKVYLTHQTVKEWWASRTDAPQSHSNVLTPLQQCRDSFTSERSNSILSKICLIYLSFDVFENDPPPTHPLEEKNGRSSKEEYDDRRHQILRYAQSHDFLEYAAAHWPHHFRLAGEHDLEMLRRWEWVCQTQSKRFYTWFRVFWYSHGMKNDLESQFRTPTFSALALASFLSHLPIVKYLVMKGEELESKRGTGWPPLLTAISQRDTAVATFLVDRGAYIHSEIITGWTPLGLAAARGLEDFVKYLISNGADVEQKTHPGGMTALIRASEAGHRAVVEILLNNGANFNIANNRDVTALMLAAANGHRDVTELLLDKGADVQACSYAGWTALHYATSCGHETLTDLLLERGALPDAEDENERTPISWAARRGLEHATKSLINKGAQVNCEDDEGLTPLMHAIRLDHLAVAKELLGAGAYVNTSDDQGQPALSFAVQCKDSILTQLLLDYGADPDAADNGGVPALFHATRLGYLPIVRILLARGANANIRDHNGQTALIYAAQFATGHVPLQDNLTGIVSLFFNVGADINAVDNQGRTALSYSLENPCVWERVIRALLDAKADPNILDNNGRGPLHSAVATIGPLTEMLLMAGAEPNIRDAEGKTPLDVALAYNRESTIRIIKEALYDEGIKID